MGGMRHLSEFPNGVVCQFCRTNTIDELSLGKIYQSRNVIVHYFCLLTASQLEQRGNDKAGILGFLLRDVTKELKRASSIVCTYCGEGGAAVQCRGSRKGAKCNVKFHLACGLKNNSLHQFFDRFQSFCVKHRPVQMINKDVRTKFSEKVKSNDFHCVLCYNPISLEKDRFNSIWPPCCNPQHLLHRTCIQKMANTAGYYCKCPLCNNKQKFVDAIKYLGIYVPDQEAAWETEPNAFRELLVRNRVCDSPECSCPKGRNHTSKGSRWEFNYCYTCGAKGIHIGCLPSYKTERSDLYQCEDCLPSGEIPKQMEAVNSANVANCTNAAGTPSNETAIIILDDDSQAAEENTVPGSCPQREDVRIIRGTSKMNTSSTPISRKRKLLVREESSPNKRKRVLRASSQNI